MKADLTGLFLTAVSLLFLSACTYNYEPHYEFTQTDTSDYSYTFYTREDYSMSNGYIKAEQTSSSNSINNWVLTHDYKLMPCTGFEAEIKVNEYTKLAGFQLFKKDSYDCYYFAVYPDGQFRVILDADNKWTYPLKLSADESHIVTNDFNKIKVQTCTNGSVEIYINDCLVKTFEMSEMNFQLTQTDKITVAYQTGAGVSLSNPAVVYFKLKNIQQLK